jgi:superfamily II DNA helicase RecQ
VCTGHSVEHHVADAHDRIAAARRGGGAGARPAPAHESGPASAAATSDADDELFERLRTLRKRLADEQGVPAYIVFSDKVLRELAEHRPQRPYDMLQVSGVGPAKLERYGDAFLDEIRKG